MTVTVGWVRPGDEPIAAALINAVHGIDLQPNHEALGCYGLLACVDGRPAGAVRFCLQSPETRVRKLVVRPGYHRTTAAIELIRAVAGIAKAYGSRVVTGLPSRDVSTIRRVAFALPVRVGAVRQSVVTEPCGRLPTASERAASNQAAAT